MRTSTLLVALVAILFAFTSIASSDAASIVRAARQSAASAESSALQPEIVDADKSLVAVATDMSQSTFISVGIFTIANFNTELAADNANYGRFKQSSLHALVTTLRGPATWNANSIALLMKAVPYTKWAKYTRTRAYLEANIPGLTALLRPVPINFRTKVMSAILDNTQLHHEIEWDSDTAGGLASLGNVRTRESVTWPQWSDAVLSCIDQGNAEYRRPGHHNGLGTSMASTGTGTDNHSLLGPFGKTLFQFNQQQPAVAPMDQVYEYSQDGGLTWLPIANSRYTITRKVEAAGNGKVKLSITKTNTGNPLDTFTVTKVL